MYKTQASPSKGKKSAKRFRLSLPAVAAGVGLLWLMVTAMAVTFWWPANSAPPARTHSAPATHAAPRSLKGARICVVVDSADTDSRDSPIHGLATLVQGLAAEFSEVVVLATSLSGEDVDAEKLLKVITMPSEENEEPTHKVKVEVLPPYSVPLDVSIPVAVSYTVMEWLRDQQPQFTSVHFLSPAVAHYSVQTRQQGLGLTHTPLVAHFLRTVGGQRRRSQQELESVEDLEAGFMEASVGVWADAVVVDSPSVAAELQEAKDAHIPRSRLPEADTLGPAPAVVPLPASPAATGLAHTGGALHRQCTTEHSCMISSFVFWGALESSTGLERFLDAVDAVLELLHRDLHGHSEHGGSVEEERDGPDEDGPDPAEGLEEEEDGQRHDQTDGWDREDGAAETATRRLLKVEFIGRPGMVNDVTVHGGRRAAVAAVKHIEERARNWGSSVHWRVHDEMAHDEAVQHLRRLVTVRGEVVKGGVRVVVVPELDGTPVHAAHRVQDCLWAGIPVLVPRPPPEPPASGWGGGGAGAAAPLQSLLALAHPADQAAIAYDRSPHGLAEKLHDVLKSGVVAGRLQPQGALVWVSEVVRLHGSLALALEGAPRGSEDPLVSVVIVHHNRPVLLHQAVASIIAQDYKNREIIVVDNGSSSSAVKLKVQAVAETLRQHGGGGRVLSLPRSSLAAARNRGAEAARGEFLLFMDDDNYAAANEVRVLVTAARNTGADMLAPAANYFHGTPAPQSSQAPAGRWLPLGAAPALGFFRDCFGDSNAFVRASVFRALGGWLAEPAASPDYSTGEDWQFFANAVLKGYTLQVVAFPLFWYRQSAGSLGHSTSLALYRERVLQPYMDHVAPHLQPMLRLAAGIHHRLQDAEGLRVQEAEMRGLLSGLLCAHEDSRQPPDLSNLVVNGNMTVGRSGMADGWSGFGEGYSWFVPSDGFLVMQSLDGAGRVLGAQQKLLLRQSQIQPLLVGARSRADTEHHKDLHADYSVYIDLEYTDGTFTYGIVMPFRAAHQWQVLTGVIHPPKPIMMVHMYTLFRYRRGTAHFDDIYLRPLTTYDLCATVSSDFPPALPDQLYTYTSQTPILLHNDLLMNNHK